MRHFDDDNLEFDILTGGTLAVAMLARQPEQIALREAEGRLRGRRLLEFQNLMTRSIPFFQ
jgi:hypothetical protein